MVSLLELILLQPGVTVSYAEILTDGGLELWTSPTDLTNWSETTWGDSTVNREAVVKRRGAYSCRLEIDAAGSEANIQQNNTLAAFAQHIIRLWYKTGAGEVIQAILRNETNLKYLNSAGGWQAGWTSFTNPLSNAAGAVFTFPFKSDKAAIYGLTIFSTTANAVVYVDEVSLKKVLT